MEQKKESKGRADCPGREDGRNQRRRRAEKGRHTENDRRFGSQPEGFSTVQQE